MRKLVTIFLLFIAQIAVAQTDYAINKIPENLLNDAVAVVRKEEQNFDFKSINSGKIDYKIAITILNKAGENYAEFAEVYDKFSSIYNIKASIYDAMGKKIKDYKSADIKDQSLISDYSIFEDNRIKYLKFFSLTYPYTIEYSYSQDFKGVLTIPSWNALKGYGISTEKSIYTLVKYPGTQIKFLTSQNLKQILLK